MDVIQPNSSTSHMRLANWLVTVREIYARRGRDAPLRVLSFGCSIGDEVATVLQMFPDAEVHGVDAQEGVLEIARRTLEHLPNVRIYRSDPSLIAAHGPFDLIICSAVLCMNPAPPDYAKQFPFSRFVDALGVLDDALAPGGFFIIANAGYRFADTPFARSYGVMRSDIVHSAGFVDVLNKSGSWYLKQMGSLSLPIYRCLGNCSGRHDEDLADSIFEKGGNPDLPVDIMRVRPVPAGLTERWSMVRSSLDGAKGEVNDSYLPVTHTYRFMEDERGQQGYSVEVAWRSFQTGEWHRRPPFWKMTKRTTAD